MELWKRLPARNVFLFLLFFNSSLLLSAAPSIVSLSPSSTPAGTTGFTLTVNGTGFVSGARVLWNGFGIYTNTTFISGTQLTAALSDSVLTSQGTATITVQNPDSSTSNGVMFTITAPVASNPVPSLTSISPTNATAGGAAFTLTVNGSNFISSSVVQWNGSSRATTFVSSNQLAAAITAADIGSTSGPVQVTVFNPTPGGGTSSPLNFSINATSNPAPVITSVSPLSATVGGAAFTLTVTGSNFISSSVVQWNGSSRATTFVSSTQLTAAITAADIITAGSAQVTMFNPAPGGGVSNAVSFTISAAAAVGNPLPRITWISPMETTAGGTGASLTVWGVGFVPGSVVQWNGSNRSTTFISNTQLTASLTAADTVTAGRFPITVFSPTPGGGTSPTWEYTVTSPGVSTFPSGPQPVGLGPVSVAVDSALGRIYTLQRRNYYSAPPPLNELAQDIGFPPTNVVTVTDQKTGNIVATIGVGNDGYSLHYPQSIAVDSTRHRVYVTNSDDSTVSVLDGATNTTVTTVAVDSAPSGVDVDPDIGIVYVAASNVTLLDAATGVKIGSISVGGPAKAVVVDRTSHLAYVIVNTQTVVVVDGLAQTVRTQLTSSLTLVQYGAIAIEPGVRAYACDSINGWISVLSLSGPPAWLTNFHTPGCNAIAADPANHLVYAATGNTVNIYRPDGTLQQTVGGLRFATSIAVDMVTGHAYVTGAYAGADVGKISDRLNVLDTQSLAHVGNIVLGTFPYGMVYDSGSKRLYVADVADAVNVVDTTTQKVISTWSSDGGPQQIAVDSLVQQVYVSNNTDQTVTILSSADGSLKETFTATGAIAVNHVNDMVYVANGTNVLVINGKTNQIAATIPSSNPVGFAIDETAGRVYVSEAGSGSITVIDSSSNKVLATWYPKISNVWHLAVDPALGRLYVVAPNATGLIGVFTGLQVLDSASGAFITQIAAPKLSLFANDPSAEAVAVNPKTHHIFMSSIGDGVVTVIDGAANAVLASLVVGGDAFNGYGLAVDPDSGLVYVSNTVDATIAVFADQFSSTAPNPVPSINLLAPSAAHARGRRVHVDRDWLEFCQRRGPAVERRA